MGERIIELETCTVILPDDFDANRFMVETWKVVKQLEAAGNGMGPTLLPAKQRRKVISENQPKLPENS